MGANLEENFINQEENNGPVRQIKVSIRYRPDECLVNETVTRKINELQYDQEAIKSVNKKLEKRVTKGI